ncbi:MAG: DNA gyrase subunit A [Acidobacteria bacterium]|nr:DNA gyrase subunit A [Acidobacteriota bacterium]
MRRSPTRSSRRSWERTWRAGASSSSGTRSTRSWTSRGSGVSQVPLEPHIEAVDIEVEVKRSYLDYAMSVIVGRALPDARDGLKPVHRRIMHGMNMQGVRPGTPFKKSARVVGDVMGKYHPHGDQAIYDALARMAQDFAMRAPLVQGHGNFGSVDGDPPAAARYTECRLSPLAMELLRDIDEETVDFVPNYDGEETEPLVLPGRFPNLLVNGSSGIAVGMATNIPPHNLRETVDAVIAAIDDPDITVAGLMKHMKGPDFPGGGMIMGRDGIRDAFTTGRGSIKVRGLATIEEMRSGKSQIVVTELPYMVSGDRVLAKIADLVDRKVITGITPSAKAVRNESNRRGLRLVIELKRDAIPQVVLNNIYKHTQLQDSFGVNTLALVDGIPRVLPLTEAIKVYIAHQIEVVNRRTRYRLRKAEERDHVLQGLLIALENLDAVIKLIRGSRDVDAARAGLMTTFKLSEIQANAILDMQLRRLAALERKKIEDEHRELVKKIKEYRAILADPGKVRAIVKEELAEVKQKYGTPRRTEIRSDEGEIDVEDLVPDDEVAVTISLSGYVKRVPLSVYRTQGRGGRGVRGAAPKQGDILEHLLTTTNHAFVLFFSNRGKVYRIKAHEIPEKDRTARGISIRNLLPLAADETIAAVIDTRGYDIHRYLVIATRRGIVKKTEFQAYDSSRRDGIIAVKLRPDDEVVRVRATSGDDRLILVSRKGQGIHFKESEVRPMGRDSSGVIGMKLRAEDAVVSFDVADPNGELLAVTDAGFGKRTPVDRFEIKHRGGLGVRAVRLTGRRGFVAGAEVVRPGHEVFLISSDGVVIRMACKDISRQGRAASGVRVMRLAEDSAVAAIARVVGEEENGG